MKRGRKPQPFADTSKIEEPIGHISVPIEDNDLKQTHLILTQHGVRIRKSGSSDNWWLLLFPNGTIKTNKKTEHRLTSYTVRLPDGFCFLLQEGVFHRNGTYAIPPQIFI